MLLTCFVGTGDALPAFFASAASSIFCLTGDMRPASMRASGSPPPAAALACTAAAAMLLGVPALPAPAAGRLLPPEDALTGCLALSNELLVAADVLASPALSAAGAVAAPAAATSASPAVPAVSAGLAAAAFLRLEAFAAPSLFPFVVVQEGDVGGMLPKVAASISSARLW